MSNSHSGFIIFVSILIALILTLLPMPSWTIWMRPIWVFLVLAYWSMYLPYQVSVGIAWFVGIILDVLNGTLLGEHALALTIVIYVVVHMHSRLRMFGILQQSLSILLLALFYQTILYCVQGFIGALPQSKLYWSASFTSMLLWPWVYSILGSFRRRFKIS